MCTLCVMSITQQLSTPNEGAALPGPARHMKMLICLQLHCSLPRLTTPPQTLKPDPIPLAVKVHWLPGG